MRRVLSIVLALALLVAACGGSDDDASSSDETTTTTAATETTAAEATTTAAPATTEAPSTTEAVETTEAPGDTTSLADALGMAGEPQSARLEGTMTMTGMEGADPGTEFTIPYSGEFDNVTGNSSFIMDMSGIAGAMPESEIPPEMADMFGEMEVRTIGDTSYMRFGFFSMLGVQTEWVSFPVEEAGTAASSFGATPTNPMDFMDAWNTAGSDIEDLGSETVRGVNTTHYRVTMDTAAMMEAADEEAAAEFDSLGASYLDSLPVEFWVGDDGNLYRMMMTVDGTADPTSGFESMTMVWEMFDYGASINIEAPPADQVTDGSEMAGMFSGMAGE